MVVNRSQSARTLSVVFAKNLRKPLSHRISFRNVEKHPRVSMIAIREYLKGESALRVRFLEILLCFGDRSFVTDELWSASQSAESGGCRGAVAAGVSPSLDSVIVAVADETPPQLRDLVVMQTDVIAGD